MKPNEYNKLVWRIECKPPEIRERDRAHAEKVLVRYWAMTCYEQPNTSATNACLNDYRRKYGDELAEKIAEVLEGITPKSYFNYHEPSTYWVEHLMVEANLM